MVNFNPFSKELNQANQKFLAKQRGEQSIQKIRKLQIPEKIKQELINAEVFDFWFNEKDISSLIDELIQSGDILQYAATGINERNKTTLIVVTERHLLLLSKKMFSKPILQVINLSDVKSISLQKYPFYGELCLVIGNNILKINSINKTSAPSLAEKIKQFSVNKYSYAADSKENIDTQIDQLKKLKELEDQGILTEEEFQAKKKQILGL